MSFKHTELFGGAITANLPTRFGDVSQIREVPDHQEVFLDTNGYSGVIFEILQYVEKPTDDEALQYHFTDLVEGTGDSTNILEQGSAVMTKIPNKPIMTLSFIQTPPPTPPEQAHRKIPEYVFINLILLRLKDQATDIMITINAPHYAGEYEKSASAEDPTQLMKDAVATKEKILETFEIQDWDLFQG